MLGDLLPHDHWKSDGAGSGAALLDINPRVTSRIAALTPGE